LASVSDLTLLRLLKAHEYVGYVASDLKVTRVISFSSAFVKAVEDSMKGLVGVSSTEGFFKYMERAHSLPKDQILIRFEEFENGLHEIFANGAPIIEKAIVNHLMSGLGPWNAIMQR
jgi:hypothetical protein